MQNVSFSNCSFAVTDGTEFDNLHTHGAAPQDDFSGNMSFKYVDNLTFNNTSFDVNRS